MSTPTLTNLTAFPPGGYQYFEPAVMWRTTHEMAMGGLEHVAMLLQTVRLNNPAAGLDPTYSACLEAVKQFTCVRLGYDPKFCGVPPAEMQIHNNSQPTVKRRCSGCSRR